MPLIYYALPFLALKPAFRLTMNGFEQLLLRGGNSALIGMMVSLVVFWHVYTPVHELLHVAACLSGGGTVSELALKPQYGGTLLAEVFPFVVADSDYAGQLTGFTTPNDWVYAWVDLAPYLLSLPGLVLLVIAVQRRRVVLFGPAMVLTWVPLMSFSGDFFELVSLVATRLVPWLDATQPARLLVSDDGFKLVGVLAEAGLLWGPLGLVTAAMFGAAVWVSCLVIVVQLHLVHRVWRGFPDLKYVETPPSEADTGA